MSDSEKSPKSAFLPFPNTSSSKNELKVPTGLPPGTARFKPEKKILDAAIEIIPNKLWIYKQEASRNWHARCRFDGETRYKTFTTKTPNRIVAQEAAMEGYYELKGQIKAGIPLFSISFGNVANLYLQKMPQLLKSKLLTQSAFNSNKSYIGNILMAAFSEHRLNDINDDEWQKFLALNSNLSPGSLGNIRAALRKVFQFAIDEKHYKGEMPELKMPKAQTVRRAAFTIEEWFKIEQYLEEYPHTNKKSEVIWNRRLLRLFCKIMIRTGMRTNDRLFLKWCHISTFNENGTDYTEIYAQGKNKKRHLAADIGVWDLFQELRQLYPDANQNDLIFRTSNGYAYDASLQFKEMLKKIDLLYDTEGKVRVPYSMRHSYATWRLEAGVSSFTLAKNMGTSTAMIDSNYGHFDHKKHARMLNHDITTQFLIPVAPEIIDARIVEGMIDDEDDSE